MKFPMYDLILKNGTCVFRKENKTFLEKADIAIRKGQIEKISSTSLKSEAHETLNLKGLHILPGLIDTQVHFRDPGLTHKEDFFTGTRAAIAGGITSLFDMPNTSPSTIDKDSFQKKLNEVKKKSWCDFALFLGACPENLDHLSDLEQLPHCCGIKVFMGSSTGTLLVSETEKVARALQNGSRRMAFHCENEERLNHRKKNIFSKELETTVHLHPFWRDEECAFLATKELISLARKHQRPVHVLHVTTQKEMEFLKNQKDIATVECTPQHLTLIAPECYDDLGTLAQMNPPIRTQKHQEALWKGIHNNTVDIIGSDHAPHTLEEKKRPYPESPSGMTGVQTTLPIMLNHVFQKRLSLEKLCDLMAHNPATIYKIKNKGFLKEQNDADITVVDLKAQKTITNSWIQSKSAWTPFHNVNVTGWPIMTFIRGQKVMENDKIIGVPMGKPIDFVF